MYFSDELDPSWRAAWNAGKQESELRNHRGGTSRKIASAMLWVCLDFQDQGIQSIEDISPDNWLAFGRAMPNGFDSEQECQFRDVNQETQRSPHAHAKGTESSLYNRFRGEVEAR